MKARKVIELPGSQGLFNAEWSPDGRYIQARRGDHHALMTFSFKTQQWTELANGEVSWAIWSRDSQYVYFERHGNEHAIMRVRMADRRVEHVADLEKLKRTGTTGGFWFGLTPDDSSLVLRDTGTQEIYALDWKQP